MYSSMSGGLWVGSPSIETPFQDSKNVCHQARSGRNATLSRTNDSRLDPDPLSRSNMRLRNVLPGRTTLQACCSFPVSDHSSLMLQNFLPLHWARRTCSSVSLSWGRRKHIRTESSSMPRKDKPVVGPSSFSIATGILSMSKDPPEALEVHHALVRVRSTHDQKVI